MNVNFEKTGQCEGVITISLVEDDYKADVKKELVRLSTRRPIKGFRPGHVPAGMMQKMFGAEAKAYVVDRLLNKALSDYVRDEKLPILGEPMLSEDSKLDLSGEKDHEVRFDVGLRPEFDVACDSSLAVPYYNIEVTDEMVEKQIASLRKRYSRQVPADKADETALIHGTMEEVDENGNVKEDGIKAERTLISPFRAKDDEQKQAVIGCEVGQTITINPDKFTGSKKNEIASMLNIDEAQAEGLTSDFKLYVDEIRVHQDAEMDQEFFDEVFGTGKVESEDDFRDKVREMVARQFVGDSNYRFTIDARTALEESAGELELPDAFLKRYLLSRNEKATAEDIEKEYPDARRSLIWQLIQDKAAAKLDIKIDDDAMMRTARFMTLQQMAQYGISDMPDDLLDQYANRLLNSEQGREQVAQRAFDDCFYAALKDAVTLTEQNVSVEEFQDLFKNDEPMPEEEATETE